MWLDVILIGESKEHILQLTIDLNRLIQRDTYKV